jgi:hypothetical protein
MAMPPDIADKIAKFLRLACSTGPDGEKLAAIGRLSALVAAHDLDWDQVLANGSAPALTEQQMSRIYWEGHARGCSETEQRLRPARDWTPTVDTTAEAGGDADRVETILETALQSGLLTEWETDWCQSVQERFKQYGSRLYVSAKMWAILDRLETKLRRAGII